MKCFTGWYSSFFSPLHASFLTFLSHVSIPSSFLMCHISQPLVTRQLFSLRVPLRQRGTELAGRQKVSLTVSKRQLGSNYKVAETVFVRVCIYLCIAVNVEVFMWFVCVCVCV